MERMTAANLERRVENLNRRIAGSSIRYEVQGRNGMTCLDRYHGVTGACLNTIRCGTKAEIGEFLHAMMVALDDVKLYGVEGTGGGREWS